MRRSLLILFLCLLLGLLIWWRPTRETSSASETAAAANHPPPASILTTIATPAETPTRIPSPPHATAPVLARETAPPPAPDPRLKRAYVLRFDQGALTLVAQENIEGDFTAPRRPTEEWSRMLRLRLVSASGSVLAEELLPAPDQLCTVLDSAAETSRAVAYVVPGPVVFQVRLPRADAAVRLDVSRITQPDDPARDTALGAILLPAL